MSRIVPSLLFAAALAAGEPVLMGYAALDGQGRPQDVVVALTRERFQELEARSQAQAPAAPAALLLGPPAIALALSGSTVEGRMELPFAVHGRDWLQVRLPMPGAVSRLDGAPKGCTWSAAGPAMELRLEGGQSGVLRIAFALPAHRDDGSWRCALPLARGLGGSVSLSAPAPWLPTLAGAGLAGTTAMLPVDADTIAIGWRQPAGSSAAAGRLSLEQRIRLRLESGRIAWTADLMLARPGAGLAEIDLDAPEGLIITAAAGEGLAAWRQDGAILHLVWPAAAQQRAVRLEGIIARSSGAGSAAVALRSAAAQVSRGRLGLDASVGERFLRPQALESEQPAEGEALAARWLERPESVAVAWESEPQALVLARDAAIVLGDGAARAEIAIQLSGRGRCDNLRLGLPQPWRVVAVDGATWACTGADADRILVLSAAKPWEAGVQARIRLEADRSQLGGAPTPPLLPPRGTAVSAGRSRLLLADAGSIRVRCDGAGRSLPPAALAQELEQGGFRLRGGERWRSAVELNGDQQPQLRLEAVPASAHAVLSHYLILGRDAVRWSLHLDVVPDSGAIASTRLRLPAGSRLVSVDGLGLGRWRIEDGALELAWAAPLTAAATVDLELDLPIGGDGAIRVPAPAVDGMPCSQQVALVEEDDLGLVRRDADGLGDLEQPFARLPAGVDRTQVRWLWKASRADWSLALSREPLVGTAGADGLATLVDGTATVLPDGGQRGSATWHVVNRSRQQLPLTLAAGCTLWEARVDGRMVRPRRDADGSLWLPLPPMRPGQATSRVSLVWAAEAKPGALRLEPPMLGGLKVMGSVWRVSAPEGWSVRRTGGQLQEADAVEAAADRAQAVIDEIQRLQAVDGLAEAGLRRLEGQLAILDSELKDHLASLGARADRLRGAQAASAIRLGKAASTVEAIASNSQRLNEIQQQITQNFSARGSRKRGLRLDDLNRDWGRGSGVVQTAAADGPARHLPSAWPWEDALAPSGGGGLGSGAPPPGAGGSAGTALTGIELTEAGGATTLVLRGQGEGMQAELAVDPPRGPLWPWLLTLASALAIAAGTRLSRRRPG